MTAVTEFLHHVGSVRWSAVLARSMWQGPLPTIKHASPSEYVPLWWGPVVYVNPGDELVLLPTLDGVLVDEVRPSVWYTT